MRNRRSRTRWRMRRKGEKVVGNETEEEEKWYGKMRKRKKMECKRNWRAVGKVEGNEAD
jgi:hypothetical protein